MEEKRNRQGRLYNGTHAQCIFPNPSTHAIGAMLTLDSFRADYRYLPRVESRCRNCRSEDSKRRLQEKKLNNVCQKCDLTVVFSSLCEWHWFRTKAREAFHQDKRIGKYTTQECDALAVYIRSIYPKDEICPYCGTTMTRKGGSTKDGIRISHWKNVSLDAIHNERGHVAGNLLWVCYRCNEIKSDSRIEDIGQRIESLRTIERIMQQQG